MNFRRRWGRLRGHGRQPICIIGLFHDQCNILRGRSPYLTGQATQFLPSLETVPIGSVDLFYLFIYWSVKIIKGTVPLCETVPVVTEEIRPRIGIRGKNKELSQIIILKSHREGVLRRDAE